MAVVARLVGICAAALAVGAPAPAWAALPPAKVLSTRLASAGYVSESEEVNRLNGRPSLVSMPYQREVAALTEDGFAVRVTVYTLGKTPARSDSVSIAVSLAFDDPEREARTLFAVVDALKLGAEINRAFRAFADEAFNSVRRQEAKAVDNNYIVTKAIGQVRDERGTKLVFRARANGSFMTRGSYHPGGSQLGFQFQLIGASLPEAYWPTPSDLAELQTDDRWFNLGYHGSDVPIISKPDVVDLNCRTAGKGRGRFRCSYVLTLNDWIGGRDDAPRKRIDESVFRRPDGSWQLDKPNLHAND